MKNKKETFLRWLNGEDILMDTISQSAPRYDPEDSNPHTYEALAHTLEEVEEAEERSFNTLYIVISIVLAIFLAAVLLISVSHMPRLGAPDSPVNNEVSERYIESGLQETGATNLVAGMILDYRAFDTLGESHVLFTAMCAVVILLSRKRDENHTRLYWEEEKLYDLSQDIILRYITLFLVPCLMIFGIYILLNGHLSPGGGFSGGAILGAALILYSMVFRFKATERFLSTRTIKVITCCSLGFYVAAKAYSFFTGANGLHSIISPGVPGRILSAGLILPLNVSVGLVVACTMYSFFSLFKRGTV